jgi:hypothetical protein
MFTVPDWALHCTQNPDITVQYISDSGAVQLSRHCQDSVKEISCQGKMNQGTMYDELKCPEEQTTTIASSESTIVEISSTTTEESHPEVIIKNPQKMFEDVFNDIVETNIEVDSNRLDVNDAKKDLDLMMGDAPAAETPEDKKTLLKLTEKKEVYQKKTIYVKKDSRKDEEPMMGDAPAEEVHDEHSTTVSGSTTDRQRRDIAETTLPIDVNISTEAPLSTQHSEATAAEEINSTPSELTTEAQQITSVITEETTTKFIVQGHPLFHSQVVFKEPIQVIEWNSSNGTGERKDVSNTDDHFIPPMLLVKARFTATKSTEGATEETKEMTTDYSTSVITDLTSDGQTVTEVTEEDKNVTAKPTESNEIGTNEISSVTQLETTPALTSIASEKPILIEKRNDPRLGLYVTTTSTLAPVEPTTETVSTTEQQQQSTTEESTTITEELSSSTSYESSSLVSIDLSSTTEAQTEVSETSEASSSVEMSTKQQFEIFAATSQPETVPEKLIESTTAKVEATSAAAAAEISPSVTPIAIKLTTLKMPETSSSSPQKRGMSKAQMGNDINDSHHESHERSDETDDSSEHHLESSLNNEDFQPYKPNRHRSISHEHHHGPGFSIGKILG